MYFRATPLTADDFAPFGTVINSPLPPSTSVIPEKLPPGSVHANQNTALKYANVSPISSTYYRSSSGIPAQLTTSLFSCFPHSLRTSKSGSIFDVDILERHPFTTQSFVPFSPLTSRNTKALIVVAPTLKTLPAPSALTPYFPQSHWNQGGPPDLKNLKAFLIDGPRAGVTYGIGTWHAPMVVIGDERVDFFVTQWANGREGEDCQEVELKEEIEISVNFEGENRDGRSKLWESGCIVLKQTYFA